MSVFPVEVCIIGGSLRSAIFFCADYYSEVINIDVKKVIMNDMIREKELRVIDSDGTQLGIISREEAIQISIDKGMDLVIVSMDSKPSVAKIMDFGRFKFEQDKRLKETKKKQKESKVKEIQLTVGIGQHDMDYRARMAEKELADGNGVRIVLKLRGREKAHPENGITVVEGFISLINGTYKIEKKPTQESFNIVAILAGNE